MLQNLQRSATGRNSVKRFVEMGIGFQIQPLIGIIKNQIEPPQRAIAQNGVGIVLLGANFCWGKCGFYLVKLE
jgi:hypothetical protein